MTRIAFLGAAISMMFSINARAAIFTVINTNNSGAGSLRDAMDQANSTSTKDTVYFNIPGNAPYIIQPLSNLPIIAEPLVIDGFSQPGNNYVNFDVVIDGSNTQATNGVVIGASNCIVQGLKVINFGSGAGIAVTVYTIYLGDTLNNNQIRKNYIDSCGRGIKYSIGDETKAIGNKIDSNIIMNHEYCGIYVTMGGTGGDEMNSDSLEITNNTITGSSSPFPAIYFTIGGTGGNIFDINYCTISGNDISNNQGSGLYMDYNGTGSTIVRANNYNIINNTINNNSYGIYCQISGPNLIGGYADNYIIQNNQINNNAYCGIELTAGGNSPQYIRNHSILGNQIKYNGSDGIRIYADGFFGDIVYNSNHHIEGNYIIGNAENGIGLTADGSPSNCFINDITITLNIIDSNKQAGIRVDDYGGFAPNQGPNWTGNNYQYNSIYNNDSLGIKIIDWYFPNKPKYPLPMIDTIYNGPNSVVEGHLNGLINKEYIIDLYYSDYPDSLGFGEGEYFIVPDTITTDNTGYASFSISTNMDLTNVFCSGTSTSMNSNNTSEFGNVYPYNYVPLSIDAITISDDLGVLCDAVTTVTISDGIPPYVITWSNNETTVTIDSLCAGTYAVTVSDSVGWTAVDSVMVVDIVIGLETESVPRDFVVYPNPTTSTFTVQGTTGTIEVLDIFGRHVLTTTNPQVDMSNHPKGIYLVRVGEVVRKLVLR